MNLKNLIGDDTSYYTFNSNYTTRLTKGILGYPHRKRLHDITKHCSAFTNMITVDIGCNDLYFDKGIIPNQKEFIGCDLGWEDSLTHAKENIEAHRWDNVAVIKAVGEHVPLINNHFELVLCCETLEHVTDEKIVTDEIKRISKNKSILVVSAPIEQGPIVFFKEFFKVILYGATRYSFKELLYASVLCDLKHVRRVQGIHKGYNYKNSIKLLKPEFVLNKKINTPIKWLPDCLSYGTILIFNKI